MLLDERLHTASKISQIQNIQSAYFQRQKRCKGITERVLDQQHMTVIIRHLIVDYHTWTISIVIGSIGTAVIIITILQFFLIIEDGKISLAVNSHGGNPQMELRWKLWQELSDILRLCPSQSNFLPMTTQKYIWINFFLKTICRE